ncbi:hypothetical protein NDU88_006208 [Pleurodeles waltl]|uniref:Uncharacterized protein n=1 Tax=Pleurodeles waltl TaxID=8319 RepID=A0AAV7NPL8_PLEWA|nr:hypothetical protein NDU88_006208 [Pleurodeles waltl]
MSEDARGPSGISSASFPSPEVLCPMPWYAETLDREGPFKAPGEEEQGETPPLKRADKDYLSRYPSDLWPERPLSGGSDCDRASFIDATLRCPRSTSADARGPGGTSGASFPGPEVLCPTPWNSETLDREGPFKDPGEEELKEPPPPQEPKTLEELTATLEEGKATQQPSIGGDAQEAVRR